jgi:hypothetical protein
MEPSRTHLDAGADDLVESGGRFFFAPEHLDRNEVNLVRSRLNLDGEGHASREDALIHLEGLREFEGSVRGHLNRTANA